MKCITYCTKVDCERFTECKRSEWIGKGDNLSYAGFDCEKYNWDNFLEKEDFDCK